MRIRPSDLTDPDLADAACKLIEALEDRVRHARRNDVPLPLNLDTAWLDWERAEGSHYYHNTKTRTGPPPLPPPPPPVRWVGQTHPWKKPANPEALAKKRSKKK